MEKPDHEQLMGIYRTFRRGVLMLPQLEDAFREDTAELVRMLSQQTVSHIEMEFVFQSMETIREVVAETATALGQIRTFIKDSTVLDESVFERFLYDSLRDDKTRTRAFATAQWNGGLSTMFDYAQKQLELAQSAFSEAVNISQPRNAQALENALQRLKEYYEELARLKEEWKNKLEEEREKSGGKPYFSGVAFELCQRYPQIAAELGVECPKDFLICIIKPLICIVVIIVIIATEGEAR